MTFQKTYGGVNSDYGRSVQQTSDGGYIISGYTGSFGAGDYDIYLFKTGAAGDISWTKTYGGASDDRSYSVQQTVDGGYIIAGYTTPSVVGVRDIYLIKTDASGDTLWTKAYGGAGDDNVRSVQQTADGGYIIAGVTTSFGAGQLDVFLIKTDAAGNVSWTKTYGGANDDSGYSVRQTSDGGYIVAGISASFGATSWDTYLIKTNAAGDTLWTKTYEGANDDIAYSVRQTTDGGYIMAGWTASVGSGYYDVYVIKTNAAGDALWTKTYGGAYDDVAYSVLQTTDGGYIIVGCTASFGDVSNDIYLIKTDAAGVTSWSKTYGGANGDIGYYVQQTSDNGYIIGGYSGSFGAGLNDVYLIKTDSSGNSGCHQAGAATVVTDAAIVAHSPATIVSAPAGVVTTTASIIGSGGLVNALCFIGIPEIQNSKSEISIHPNPSTGLFYISAKEEITSITVYNYLVEEVYASVKGEAAIDITKAAAGMYFYSVTLRDGTMAKGKLVKE
jgi:hypothetical protein